MTEVCIATRHTVDILHWHSLFHAKILKQTMVSRCAVQAFSTEEHAVIGHGNQMQQSYISGLLPFKTRNIISEVAEDFVR